MLDLDFIFTFRVIDFENKDKDEDKDKDGDKYDDSDGTLFQSMVRKCLQDGGCITIEFDLEVVDSGYL